MTKRLEVIRIGLSSLLPFVIPILWFWIVLLFKVPVSVSQFFHTYSLGVFLLVLILYYISFQAAERYGILPCLALTMTLCALSLSYLWRSGFSDNFLIGGLLPYKDAKNHYYGANLILNGFPPVQAGQSTERPLFPGFLSFVLLLTGQNLRLALAIIAQLAALGLYLSARQIRESAGAWGAALYAAFLYFFIQPWVGYSMSEMLGFILGCLGFTMLWLASTRQKWLDFLLGILVLLIAVSTRAGAFFIFPMLAIWSGWAFRRGQNFSWKTALLTSFLVLTGYLLVNSVYARLLGIPPGNSFGNFSYALYGQVRGGTGWHSAIEELGTRDPSIVYRAAWEYFLEHPISLFIAVAKSYRDFFLVGGQSIFPFGEFAWRNWLNVVLWLGTLVLMVLGSVQSFRNIRSNLSSLAIAGFLGIFLSIPMLPPIDGGTRFHASTIPFFYVLPALGTSWLSRVKPSVQELTYADVIGPTSRYLSLALAIVTLMVPPVIYSFAQKPAYISPQCPAGQEPFLMAVHPGSYVEFVKDGSGTCSSVPEVCQDDFERNNVEKSIDDFYQLLLHSMEKTSTNISLVPAIDFVDIGFHYFYIPQDKFPEPVPTGFVSGCAVEILTKNQTIYQVESLSSETK